jgi:Cu2+-containing amine oxidase
MKVFYLWLVFFIYVPNIFAHDGTDELRDLGKNKQKVLTLQKNIKDIENKQDRLESLNLQTNLLQRNILILRNKMIEDSSQIKSSMSKYDLDYMKEVDFILKKVNRTLEDTKKVLDE